MEILTDKSWKYDLQILEPTTDEFKIVENFFEITSANYLHINKNLHNFKIYEINEQNTKEEVGEQINNLMLFHGTSKSGVAGVLKEGFRNSEEGIFGKGVYLTESSYIAFQYSEAHIRFLDFESCGFYILVNEVLESDRLKTTEYKSRPVKKNTPIKNQFTKYIKEGSMLINPENYKEDHNGRLYRNITVDQSSVNDEFVADSKVVIPK